MSRQLPRSWLKVTIAVILMVVALGASSGAAAAHNPACHHTAVTNTGTDAPHYDGADGTQTASQTAFEKNPTLGGEYNENAPGSCSVGNSPHDD